MTTPRALFPDFYDNDAIASLSRISRWTVSGVIGDLDEDDASSRKAPIDMRAMLDLGRVRGAFATDETCLVTLDTLTEALPRASNNAFYLQALTDGLLVVDIEPSCPEEVAASLLSMPGILYSETSMSGRGYHLVTELPANLHEFPDAAAKRVLREEHGWYELLLDHWVTFTRTPVTTWPRPSPDHRAPAGVEEVYADLAATTRAVARSSSAAVSTEAVMPQIPFAEPIVKETLRLAADRFKEPADFHDDLSRWEFSVLGTLHGWLRTAMSTYIAAGVAYSESDTAWLLHESTRQVIPERPKHTETRNGRPYLLDRAAALVAERTAANRAARAECET